MPKNRLSKQLSLSGTKIFDFGLFMFVLKVDIYFEMEKHEKKKEDKNHPSDRRWRWLALGLRSFFFLPEKKNKIQSYVDGGKRQKTISTSI